MQAQKNEGKMTEAFELGTGSDKEQQMVDEGKIVRNEDGTYELFSQESVNGSGEVAQAGDYFKVDGDGYPYPNSKEWFEENHEHVGGDIYMQIPQPLECYQKDMEEMPEEVQYLVDNGDLEINEDDPDHYYNAELWGTEESAKDDATVIIYGADRDEDGNITNVDFNFVAKDEFDATYHLVDDKQESVDQKERDDKDSDDDKTDNENDETDYDENDIDEDEDDDGSYDPIE